MDVHESIQTKVFRITKTAISMETEMGMEISVVQVVYKVKTNKQQHSQTIPDLKAI